MSRTGKIALAVVAVVLAGAGVWYAAGDRLVALAGGGGGSGQDGGPGTRAVPVEIADVTRGRVLVTVETTGELEAGESVALTTDAEGLVQEVAFEEGGRVGEGEVLVRLDAEEEQAALRSARARRDEIQLQLTRATELAEKDFAAEARVDELQAQVAKAEANVDVAEANLAERRIRAPFDGWIGLRQVSPGTLVEPGTTIARLWSVDPMELRFDVPSHLGPRLSTGQRVIARSRALPGGRIEGEVRAIENAVDEATRTISLEAAFDNQGGTLRPGTFVTVELVLETHADAVLMPEEALLLRGSSAYVYVVQDDQTVRRQEVEVGERRQGEAEIVAGLDGGEAIVVAGLQNVSDGQKVQPASGAGRQDGGPGGRQDGAGAAGS